jgi:hypothetical protein
MKYTPYETVLVEPEHENELFDEQIEIGQQPVEVEVKQSIHSPDRPFLTYWEIEYLESTPNRELGETVIITENKLSNYQVPVVGSEEKTEEETYGLLAEPTKES